jgi:nucleoside triphosphate pyrophosphatase
VSAAHADRFVLASASPARLATLRSAGIEPRVVVSGVDESQVTDPEPATVATRLAELKAQAVAAEVDPAGTSWVLGCDSVLELGGRVLGKPDDEDDARARWHEMRGRSGVLHTGHHLVRLPGGASRTATASTTVHFADLDDAEIAAYVGTGEPLLVAGAFTIDGLGGPYVERIEGDHHNVVGISLPLVRRLLADLGVSWSELRNHAGSAPSTF